MFEVVIKDLLFDAKASHNVPTIHCILDVATSAEAAAAIQYIGF